MKMSLWLAAGTAAMLVLACSSQKQPAQETLNRMQNTMDSIHDAAAKYAPDTLKSVQDQVNSVRQSFDKGDYAAVLAAAPTVNAAIVGLRKDANEKQAAADAEIAKVKQEWRNLTYEVPKMIADLHTQVDTLSSGRGLPRGVTKSAVAAAKDGVAGLDSQWTEANTAVSSGDYAGAVTKGQAVKDKAAEMMKSLGMKTS
jgi:hypothetical protein